LDQSYYDLSIDNTYTGCEIRAFMRPEENDQSSTDNEDLGDIRILKNLLELQSRLGPKTDSMENESD